MFSGCRSALVCILFSLAVTVHAKDVSKSDRNGRVLSGKASGNLFGFLSVKTCRETSTGVFETFSTSRLAALFGNGDSTGIKGSCSDQCKSLCPTTCYGSSKVDGSKCTCSAFKCSGNALCKDNKQCQCKVGFNGNGLTCCDASVPGCAPPAPSTPSAPQPPSSPSAPRPPVVGADIEAPKLLSVALSQSTVDVTTSNKTISVDIEVQDRSGFRVPQVVLGTDGNSAIQYSVTYPYEESQVKNYTSSQPVKISCMFNVTTYVPAGDLFLSFSFSDLSKYFNGVNLRPSDLIKLNLPYNIEVVNPRSDQAPPELIKINQITPLPVSVATLRTTGFLLEIVVQDDFAGWQSAIWEINNANRTFGISAQLRLNRPYIAGVPVPRTFNMTAFSTPPVGVYMSMITLVDGAGKRSVYNGTKLGELGWTDLFQIVA